MEPSDESDEEYERIEEQMSRNNRNQLQLLAMVAAAQSSKQAERINRNRQHVSELSGIGYALEQTNGHETNLFNMCRMNRAPFLAIVELIRPSLKEGRLPLEASFMIFMHVLSHSNRNRSVQDRFQISGETVSRHFRKVLYAILALAPRVITQPSVGRTPPEIEQSRKYYPWFKDCIGAIDGTHIECIVPSEDQKRYRSRKGTCSMNVMAACTFDMKFTYVHTGFEGSMADSRVLREVMTANNSSFFVPPVPFYYVVDSGYPNIPGFLAPYKKARYHLDTFRNINTGPPDGYQEVFNYKHSSLRNVIERCFGVLKARFRILKSMSSYDLERQSDIVMSCFVVHNLIKMYATEDTLFERWSQDIPIVEIDPEEESSNQAQGGDDAGNWPNNAERVAWGEYRDHIANLMWGLS